MVFRCCKAAAAHRRRSANLSKAIKINHHHDHSLRSGAGSPPSSSLSLSSHSTSASEPHASILLRDPIPIRVTSVDVSSLHRRLHNFLPCLPRANYISSLSVSSRPSFGAPWQLPTPTSRTAPVTTQMASKLPRDSFPAAIKAWATSRVARVSMSVYRPMRATTGNMESRILLAAPIPTLKTRAAPTREPSQV